MKRSLISLSLICALSSLVTAGEIPSVGSPTPVPPPTQTSTAPGDIPSVGITEEIAGDALDTLLSALTFLTV
jgi:hypothetical protein